MAGTWLGEPQRAYPAALKAVELDPYSALGIGNAIGYARDVDRWDVADSLINLAAERGFEDYAVRWSRSQALGRGDWVRAEALCDSLLAKAANPQRLESDQRNCGSIDVARGWFRRGIELLSASAAHAIPSGSRSRVVLSQYALALAEAMRGRPEAGGSYLAAILDYFPTETLGDIDRHVSRTSMRSIAAFLGQVELAARVAVAYPPYPDPDRWITRYGEALAGGVEALARGDPEEALRSLDQLRPIDFHPLPWRSYQALAFGLTFAELGQVDSAVAYLESVIAPAAIARGSFARIQLPAIERRLAELEEARGNSEAAIRHYQRFLELWSDADPELQYQVDQARRALARLSEMEND